MALTGLVGLEDAASGILTEPRNLDFESIEPNRTPTYWTLPDSQMSAQFNYKLSLENPASGRYCFFIERREPGGDALIGNIMQAVDATPYRGTVVRLRAAVRTKISLGRGKAQLWFRVDGSDDQLLFFDNRQDRPILTNQWRYYTIDAPIAESAVVMNFGGFLQGQGQAWFDDFSLEVISDRRDNEPPKPLTEEGLVNLIALAKLLGYVRYFHPSDGVAGADWDSFAIQAVRELENSEGPEELAKNLERIFLPLAPTVCIKPFANLDTMPECPRQPVSEDGSWVVAWQHFGVGTGNEHTIYSSRRIDNRSPQRSPFGNLMQSLPGAPYRGQRIRFRAAVRTELSGPDQQAQLWLRVDRPGGQIGFFDNMADRPITSSSWGEYDISGVIDVDAEAIVVGCMLMGEGRAWLDATSFQLISDDLRGNAETTQVNALNNPSFEKGEIGSIPAGWYSPPASQIQGYRSTLVAAKPYDGDRCALIESIPVNPAELPDPEESFRAYLGGDVACQVPLALYADAAGTLPHAHFEPLHLVKPRPKTFFPTGNDRATRLADVILAWNVFQHFYPYFEVVELDWSTVLERSLIKAATDRDEFEFFQTLQWMIAQLHDGHGRVHFATNQPTRRIPLLWDWIQGQLVVTAVAEPAISTPVDDGLSNRVSSSTTSSTTKSSTSSINSSNINSNIIQPGDVILSINGQPARTALEEKALLVSAATRGWRQVRALRLLGAGQEGDEFTLEVQRGNADPFTVTLACDIPRTREGRLEEHRPDKVAEITPGIYYVDLCRISDADFEAALPALVQAQGIIFDLRGYPNDISTIVISHLTREPVTSAQWHVPLVTRPDHEGIAYDFSNWTVWPAEPYLEAKVAFLTDGRAISYAETYLAIIDFYRLAEIVGSRTAGTNGNVNPFTLPGGYRISWTGMKVLKHDGSPHHGVGILPTVSVSRTIAGVAAGRDEVLEQAIEVVGGSTAE